MKSGEISLKGRNDKRKGPVHLAFPELDGHPVGTLDYSFCSSFSIFWKNLSESPLVSCVVREDDGSSGPEEHPTPTNTTTPNTTSATICFFRLICSLPSFTNFPYGTFWQMTRRPHFRARYCMALYHYTQNGRFREGLGFA